MTGTSLKSSLFKAQLCKMTETTTLEECNLSHVPSLWLRTAPWLLEPRTPNLRGLKVDHCRQKPGALCSSYLALHFGKVSAQGSTSGLQTWSSHVADAEKSPSLRGFPKQPSVRWKSKGQNPESWLAHAQEQGEEHALLLWPDGEPQEEEL